MNETLIEDSEKIVLDDDEFAHILLDTNEYRQASTRRRLEDLLDERRLKYEIDDDFDY